MLEAKIPLYFCLSAMISLCFCVGECLEMVPWIFQERSPLSNYA